jgi:hypothetical protein
MSRSALGRSLLVAGLLCGAAGLEACSQAAGAPAPPLAALPPTEAGPLLIPAPATDQLPPAPPPRLLQVSNGGDAYAFADRAYAMDAAFADSPPDYDFDDDGASPWVWVADDGSQCVAEFTSGGGWRYYYYDPGADQPFFIEDAQYGYGFEGGGLAVIYDHDGRELPAQSDATRDEIAGQFLARATLLRQASDHDPHRAVAAADWTAHHDVISAPRQTWTQAAASVPAWQAYQAQHQAADDAHWSGERVRREAWAARVDISLGDPARGQAEWQAAQTVAVGGPAPAWSGWRAPPPPVGAVRPASGPPGFLVHNDTPSSTDRSSDDGHGPSAPTAGLPHGQLAAPRGPAAPAVQSSVAQAQTGRVEESRTDHAVPAEAYASPASAQAPIPRRFDQPSHAFQPRPPPGSTLPPTAHAPPPARMVRPHAGQPPAVRAPSHAPPGAAPPDHPPKPS